MAFSSTWWQGRTWAGCTETRRGPSGKHLAKDGKQPGLHTSTTVTLLPLKENSRNQYSESETAMACLEGSWVLRRRLYGTSSLHRLIEQYSFHAHRRKVATAFFHTFRHKLPLSCQGRWLRGMVRTSLPGVLLRLDSVAFEATVCQSTGL